MSANLEEKLCSLRCFLSLSGDGEISAMPHSVITNSGKIRNNSCRTESSVRQIKFVGDDQARMI